MVDNNRRPWFPRWASSKFAILSAVVFVAACSTDSCSCGGFEPAAFQGDADHTLVRGGQVRVTQTGLDFLEGEVPTLISQFQPGGLSFCVPPNEGTADICTDSTCDDGSDGCQLDLAVDGAQLNPDPPDTLNADITIGQIGGRDADGNDLDLIDVHGLGADCDLHIYQQSGDKSEPADVQATVPVTLSIDENSPTREMQVDVGEIQMDDFTDQVDYELKGGFLCGVADFASGLFNGTINDQIKGPLEDAVNGIRAEQLCRACGDGEPSCPSNSTCGDNAGTQTCLYPDDTCVPRKLGIEGNLKLGELIGDYSQNPDATVSILGKAADTASVDTGLNIGLRTGAEAPSFSRCVPVDPTGRPSFEPIAMSEAIFADARPGGDPFMLGIGLHKRAIEHILWSTWGGGGLCLKVDSNDVDQLSAGALGTFLPSIKDLAGGDDAVVFLQIAPQIPPTLTLGDNTVTPSGDTYTIEDPLMTLDWKDLDLHFYVYAHQRFTRVFTLRADLNLPVALASDGQGSLVPVLGDIEEAIQNIRPVKTELLQEDPQRIIDLIPTLVGLALPSVADSISQPIELPEIMGFRIALEQDDITSVDDHSMIALYADLVAANTQPYSMMLDTAIIDTDMDVSEWTDAGIPRPTATLQVASTLPAYAQASGVDDIEYSWRVDGGAWSMFHRSRRLDIQDPLLVLQGRHRIEVRARFRGDVATTEVDPAATVVTVDYAAPELSIERDGASVELAATDTVDQPADMHYRYRIVDGQGHRGWSSWQADRRIDLEAIGAPAHFRLVAQVRDRAGHVSEDDQNVVWSSAKLDEGLGGRGSTQAGPGGLGGRPQAGGCQAAGSTAPTGAAGAILAVLAGLLLMWRRRAGRADNRRAGGGRGRRPILGILMVGVVCLGAGLAGCSDESGGSDTPEQCEPACDDGQQCVEGTCQDAQCDPACTDDQQCVAGACQAIDNGCEADDDCSCEDGQIGVCGDDGMCSCQQTCADGCEDNQYCCDQSNSCQDLPDPCVDQVCDPGFGPEVVSTATGDSSSCEINEGTCECQKLPPLTLAKYGEFADVAQKDGVRAASVYNSTYTDLMVATVDDAGEPSWQFVDGMPDSGDVEGALDGPRGGIADEGPDVGTHTAIGVDADATLHVLYRDEDNAALKYARGTKDGAGYTFATKTIDTQGDTGYYADVLVADATVYAVYTVFEYNDPEDGWQTQLRAISFPTDAPLDQLEPSAEIVYAASAANPCGDGCVDDQQCFTDAAPASCVEPTDDCADDCAAGLACNAGSCQPVYETPKQAYPLMAAAYSQLSKSADGVAVTFYDHLQRQVGWANRADDTWGEPEFLGKPAGPYASGAYDTDGQWHLAYMDPTTQNLVYEAVGQGPAEVIDTGIRDTTAGYVLADMGEDVDLRVHDDGTIVVIYQDATLHVLKVATRDGSGTWTTDALAAPADPYDGAHGFFATMVRDPASSDLAVEFVINNQADPTEAKPSFHALP